MSSLLRQQAPTSLLGGAAKLGTEFLNHPGRFHGRLLPPCNSDRVRPEPAHIRAPAEADRAVSDLLLAAMLCAEPGPAGPADPDVGAGRKCSVPLGRAPHIPG